MTTLVVSYDTNPSREKPPDTSRQRECATNQVAMREELWLLRFRQRRKEHLRSRRTPGATD